MSLTIFTTSLLQTFNNNGLVHRTSYIQDNQMFNMDNFFDDKNLNGEFKKCKEKTFDENDLTVFHKCLELHQSEWTKYLLELANMILLEDLQINRDLLV